MIRRTVVSVAAAAAAVLAAAGSASAGQPYPLSYDLFDLASGTTAGVTYSKGSLTLASRGLGSLEYTDPYANANGDGVDGSGVYELGSWTSLPYAPGFPFTELVSSWNARTPAG